MTLRNVKRNVNTHFSQSIIICLVIYFAYHLLQGDRGLIKLFSLNGSLSTASSELSNLKLDHDKLLHRVKLLRSDSLCLDFLEERAKIVLGYAHKNERVVIDCLP